MPIIRCTWRPLITSQMVGRIHEKLIGERAAAFAGEIRPLEYSCLTIASGRKIANRAKECRCRDLVALVGFVMGPIAAPPNVYPCDVPSVRIQVEQVAPNGACETVSKKISGQMGGSGRSPNESHETKTRHLQVIRSALGRTRTCGLLIRSQT
jgi:hypothetical protein